MLERLNECVQSSSFGSHPAELPLHSLTESLETTRAEKRKLETQIRGLEADKAALQERVDVAAAQPEATPSVPAASSADEGELQELRDQISDLEEELADAQKREQRTRAQLLEVRFARHKHSAVCH